MVSAAWRLQHEGRRRIQKPESIEHILNDSPLLGVVKVLVRKGRFPLHRIQEEKPHVGTWLACNRHSPAVFLIAELQAASHLRQREALRTAHGMCADALKSLRQLIHQRPPAQSPSSTQTKRSRSCARRKK